MRLFCHLLFFSVSFSVSATDMFDIQGTNCSEYISKKYGLVARNLCVAEDNLYICTNPKPPFGGQLSQEFFDELKIDRINISESLKSSCRALKSKEIPKAADSCSRSDHSLFRPLLDKIGLPVHSCFCLAEGKPVLSVCVFAQGRWLSTSEFDSSRVKKELDKTCTDERVEGYRISCFCSKHYGGNLPQYIQCLKNNVTKFVEYSSDQDKKPSGASR